jgi:hypothetical protein
MLIMKTLGTIVELPHVDTLCPRRVRVRFERARLRTPLRIARADDAAPMTSTANRRMEQKKEILILNYDYMCMTWAAYLLYLLLCLLAGRLPAAQFNHDQRRRHWRNLFLVAISKLQLVRYLQEAKVVRNL